MSNKHSTDQPWSWVAALDGGGLDGRRGGAGLLRFDWPSKKISYRFYNGISGGHNPSVSSSGKYIILGNFCQTILVVDAKTLEPIARASTWGIGPSDDRMRSNTHHLWYDDETFIGAVGDHLYKFDRQALQRPEKIGAHGLVAAHELRWTADHRYIILGDLGPKYGKANQVGVFDLKKCSATVLPAPSSVWHATVDPERAIGYATTYTYTVPGHKGHDAPNRDLVPDDQREYILAVDLAKGKIMDSWSCSGDFPMHLPSDVEFWTNGPERKLYVAAGASHTVVEIDANDFMATPRVKEIVPWWWQRWGQWKQVKRNVLDGVAYGSPFNYFHLFIRSFLVSGGRLYDGVYATRVSPDGKYLVVGNRGYNCVWVLNRATFQPVFKLNLPNGPDGLHLGLHHSEMIPLPA